MSLHEIIVPSPHGNFNIMVMPNGTSYIGYLIAKNPNIEKIDLSNTQLGDLEANILITALKKNTKLIELKLDGNSISHDLLAIIEAILKEKISRLNKKYMLQQLTWLLLKFPKHLRIIPSISNALRA
jgi:Leucine-rich repeat (LRR) protein